MSDERDAQHVPGLIDNDDEWDSFRTWIGTSIEDLIRLCSGKAETDGQALAVVNCIDGIAGEARRMAKAEREALRSAGYAAIPFLHHCVMVAAENDERFDFMGLARWACLAMLVDPENAALEDRSYAAIVQATGVVSRDRIEELIRYINVHAATEETERDRSALLDTNMALRDLLWLCDELLAACEAAVADEEHSRHHGAYITDGTMAKLRAVIAKARGLDP